MFDFLRKRAEAKAKRAEEARQNDEAYRTGQEFSRAYLAELDQFIALRAWPVAEGIWGVFAKRLADSANQTEHSPIDIARVEAKIFIKEIGKYSDTMKSEARLRLAEWFEAGRTIDTESVMDSAISIKLGEITTDLLERCIERAGETVEAYQRAGLKAVVTAHYDTGKSD